jgi:hypothetical protein
MMGGPSGDELFMNFMLTGAATGSCSGNTAAALLTEGGRTTTHVLVF